MSDDKEKKESFYTKYGQMIHISIVAIVICSIMIYIMIKG